MTLNSRQKGKRGELEITEYLRERGFDARRGQQFRGGTDSPDVVGLPGFHIEVKRVEAGNPYNWLDQAVCDAAHTAVPVVFHRRSRRDWIAVLRLDDFLNLAKKESA